jgi:hypothetical protein
VRGSDQSGSLPWLGGGRWPNAMQHGGARPWLDLRKQKGKVGWVGQRPRPTAGVAIRGGQKKEREKARPTWTAQAEVKV